MGRQKYFTEEEREEGRRRSQAKWRASEKGRLDELKRTAQRTERRRRRKDEAVRANGGVCHDCGGKFPNCCFDFHHIDPTEKDMSATSMFSMSKADIDRELAKCVMVCANCHRIRHLTDDLEKKYG